MAAEPKCAREHRNTQSTDEKRASGGTRLGERAPFEVLAGLHSISHLASQAQKFKRFMDGLTIGLVVVLALTCLLSWNVAAGNAIVGQWLKDSQDHADMVPE